MCAIQCSCEVAYRLPRERERERRRRSRPRLRLLLRLLLRLAERLLLRLRRERLAERLLLRLLLRLLEGERFLVFLSLEGEREREAERDFLEGAGDLLLEREREREGEPIVSKGGFVTDRYVRESVLQFERATSRVRVCGGFACMPCVWCAVADVCCSAVMTERCLQKNKAHIHPSLPSWSLVRSLAVSALVCKPSYRIVSIRYQGKNKKNI